MLLLFEWDIEMKNERGGRAKDLIWTRHLMEEALRKWNEYGWFVQSRCGKLAAGQPGLRIEQTFQSRRLVVSQTWEDMTMAAPY